MKTKDVLLSVLAGLLVVAFWYLQLFLSFLDADSAFLMFIYPLISVAIIVPLIKHKRFRHALIKAGIFIVIALLFYNIAAFFHLQHTLLNIAIPGYGRMTAGGGFAVMMLTIPYQLYSCIALLVALGLSKAKKQENTPTNED